MTMFIHEKKDWANFTYDLDKIIDVLSRVRVLQGRLMGKLEAIGFELQDQALLSNMSLEIMKSSEIEGKNLNLREVRSSVARKLEIPGEDEICSSPDVDGAVEMTVDAAKNYLSPLTKERLFAWHACLFPTGYSGMYKILVAQYRESPMQVVSGGMGQETVHYEAPAPERIDFEMQKFLEWFNTKEMEPLIKAGVAHFWFVTIHPFEDGNGRIARTLADMLLARSDGSPKRFYSMSNQIQKERKEYYRILEATQRGDGDITLWLEWFLECLERSLLNAQEILSTVFEKALFWQKNVNTRMNERQKKILNQILDGFDGKLTSSKYAKICKVSSDTALNDLNDLVEKAVLKKSSSGGRSTWYELCLANG